VKHLLRGIFPTLVPETDEFKALRTRLLYTEIVFFLVFLLFGVVGVFFGRQGNPAFFVVYLIALLAVAFCLWLARRGQTTAASILMLISGYVAVSGVLIQAGTILLPAVSVYALLVVSAGLLYGRRGVWLMGIASSLAIFGVMLGEINHWLAPPTRIVSITQWMTYSLVIGLTGALAQTAYAAISTALFEASDSLQFNQLIIQAAPICMTIFRIEGKCVAINQAASQLLGRSQESLKQDNYHNLESWRVSGLYAAAVRAFETGEPTAPTHAQIKVLSGKKIWIKYALRPFTRGGHKHLLVIFEDETERYQAELALQAAHAELEQRVHERTTELQAANAALEKALSTRDEFMAAMSHELRTPLSTILGIAEAMQSGMGGSLTEKQNKYLQNIDQSGQRLLALVNDVLDFTHIQSGEFRLQLAPCSLAEICRASLQAVQAEAIRKKQRLEYECFPLDIVLLADARRIQQVLTALLDNAVKFTPQGGYIRLKVNGLEADHLVQISVADNGIGITPEDFPRLFRPFEQVDAGLNRSFEGSGLGLALANALVDLHGGKLGVESSPGDGSTFTLTLQWDANLN